MIFIEMTRAVDPEDSGHYIDGGLVNINTQKIHWITSVAYNVTLISLGGSNNIFVYHSYNDVMDKLQQGDRIYSKFIK